MNNIRRNLSLAALLCVGISSTGCGSKEEILYQGRTSIGETTVIRVNERLTPDDRIVIITRGDTVYTLCDYNSWGEIGGIGHDWVTLKTKEGVKKYQWSQFTDFDGRVYSSDKLDEGVINKNNELLSGVFNDMYQTALKEAADSLEARFR